MKKNILFLINGFGVEQKDSVNIYSKEVMPNLDNLTTEGFFTTLASKELDYKDGYRKFSIGINESLSYSVVDNCIFNETFNNIPLFKKIVEDNNSLKSKLHIFCFYESSRTIDHLFNYLKLYISPNVKVFIHIILCQKSINEYKHMSPVLTKLNYEFPNVKIGFITGLSTLSDQVKLKEVEKSLLTELGEQWKDLSKKLEVFSNNNTYPYDARTFNVTQGFKLENNDQILLFNYSYVDLTFFENIFKGRKFNELDFNTIKMYSLFPVKTTMSIPFAFNYAVSSTHALNSLKTINASCLILDEASKCQYINNYMTGLRNIADPAIKYLSFTDDIKYSPEKILGIILNYKQDLIIFNYEIVSSKNVEEIKERLSKIDTVIGHVVNLVKQNNYALIISSLYGYQSELYNKKMEICTVNFSTKVPLILLDTSLNKNKYRIEEGNIFDLANTIYKNINPNFKGYSLIKRKSRLLSIFYK